MIAENTSYWIWKFSCQYSIDVYDKFYSENSIGVCKKCNLSLSNSRISSVCWSFKAGCRNHRRLSLHSPCSLALSNRLEIMPNREILTIPPFRVLSTSFSLWSCSQFWLVCSSVFDGTTKLNFVVCSNSKVLSWFCEGLSRIFLFFLSCLCELYPENCQKRERSSTAVFETECVLAWNLASKQARSLSPMHTSTHFSLFSPRLVSDSWKIPTHARFPRCNQSLFATMSQSGRESTANGES